MRSLNRFVKFAAATSLLSALWACSNSNSNAPQLNSSGQHPAGWVTSHQAAALGGTSACTPCHGADLKGGISGVSCFSAQINGQFCHSGGPPQSSHPAGWRDPGLHGAAAKAQPGTTTGFSYCQTCHGADFTGGVAGVSCFVGSRATGTCHLKNGQPVKAPHAALPWRTYPSPTHTETVDDAAGSNAAVCAQCHAAGRNLSSASAATIPAPPPPYATGKPGCFNSTLCHSNLGSPHPPGWVNPSQHCIAARANLTNCQTCHADKPTGGAGSNPRFNLPVGRLTSADTGTAFNGCEVCHAPLAAHPRVMQIPAVFGTLTTFNSIGTPWYLHCKVSPSGFDTCNRCHGANLNGVGAVAGATGCTFCHRSGLPTTLLHCTSCHADPPNGTAYPNLARVHAVHTNGTVSPVFTCDDCHFGIGSVSLDHFNRAKNWGNGTTSVQAGAVDFGAFAGTGGLTPTYSDATLQCSNTYCHGATISGGINKLPIWSQTNYLTASGCGTCHGFPPTAIAPHTSSMTPTQCIGCHPHVNSSGTGFTNPAKHINGVIDATSGGGTAPHPIPVGTTFPGSVHKSAAVSPFTSCIGCHTIGSSIGGYPAVPAGTPPDCRGCHVKANPGNSCGSCHGSASNGGRPSGSTFPDIAGRHNNNHGGFSCATCHGTAGTGQAAHGSSGGVAHNGTNFPVVIQFTGEATGITFTRTTVGHGTCSGSCHGNSHTNDNW